MKRVFGGSIFSKPSKKRAHQRPNGFGLIEVLISATILSILAVGATQLFKSSFMVQRHLAQTSEAEGVRATLVQVLSNPQACASSFNGLDPSLSTPQDLILRNGATILLEEGDEKGGVTISALKASFLQTTSTVRMVRVDMKVTKNQGENKLRQEWDFDRIVNVSVAGAAVVGCLSGEGGLIKVERHDARLKPTRTGYQFYYTGINSDSEDPAQDMWILNRTSINQNCALTTTDRILGCAREAYPPITITAEGSLLVVDAYTGVCVSNARTDRTLTIISSVKITCGAQVAKPSIASLSTQNNGALCVNAGMLPHSFAVAPGDTCTIEPAVGWHWWLPDASPVGLAAGQIIMAAYPINFSITHYR